MKDTELKRTRDRDFYRTYVDCLQTCRFKNRYEAVDHVRKHSSPCFYISPKVLSNYIGIILRGDILPQLNSSGKRRLKELYKRYRDYITMHPNTNLSRERICEILVEEKAPEFYIGRSLAFQILSRERKKAIKELQNRYLR